jgi:hypothetical protein
MRDDDVRPMPAPWKAERMPGGYRVCDAEGRALIYIDAGDAARRTADWRLLSWEEARRLAVNIARLPELLSARRDAAKALDSRSGR